jgi:excisionase family DNA binding protein
MTARGGTRKAPSFAWRVPVPAKNDHSAPPVVPVPGPAPGKPVITISDLIQSGHDFTDVPVVAGILQCDRRTVRRRIADGTIPAVRIGAEYRVPVRWLVEQAGLAA